MRIFYFLLLAFTLPASALNTMPNCGSQFGSLMPDVDPLSATVSTEGLTGTYVKTYTGAQQPSFNPDGTGQTRIDVDFASSGFNDPWFKPGIQNGSHAHVCWGNILPCIYSKMDTVNVRNQPIIPDSIKDIIGLGAGAPEMQSTSEGGFGANGTAYWAPAPVNQLTHWFINTSRNLVYYKSGKPATSLELVNRPPIGLKLFGGDPNRTIPYVNNAGGDNPAKVRMTCYYPTAIPGHAANTYGEKFKSYVPPCDQGGQIQFFFELPSCVQTSTLLIDHSIDPETITARYPNGLERNPLGMLFDSPDHKSHTKYIDTVSGCGIGYARIPLISFNYSIDVTDPEGSINIVCSSDNYAKDGYNSCYSLHGDEDFGWNGAIIQEMLDECVNASLDCHAHLISPTQTLYRP